MPRLAKLLAITVLVGGGCFVDVGPPDSPLRCGAGDRCLAGTVCVGGVCVANDGGPSADGGAASDGGVASDGGPAADGGLDGGPPLDGGGDGGSVDGGTADGGGTIDGGPDNDGGNDGGRTLPTPAITGSTPGSPAGVLAPNLEGTAEANATVRLYLEAGCSGAEVASGTGTGSGTFSIQVTASANAVTTWYARAADGAGNLSACSTGFAYTHDALPPGAPGAPVAAWGANQVSLTWTAATDSGSGVSTYDVAYCSPSPCALPATPQKTAIPSTATTVTGLDPCVATVFGVRAVDGAGNAGSFGSPATLPALAPPTDLKVVPGAAAAELSWTTVAGATDYEICSASSADACAGAVVSSAGKTADRLNGLPLGTSYFSVRTVSGACRSAAATPINAPLFAATVFMDKTTGGMGDLFGNSVSLGGDADGDGRADLLVGAPGAATIYLYASGDGSLLHQKSGVQTDNYLGSRVSLGGDADGDGRADFIAGAPLLSAGDEGQAIVYSGVGGGLLHDKRGEAAGDEFGSWVSMAGDVNGDGRADFIVGSRFFNVDAKSDAGRAYVYSGLDGSVLYTKSGAQAFDNFGFAVAGGGDLNGDGKADFMVGAPRIDTVYVYSGADGSLLYQKNGTAGDSFGRAVSMGPDVDGDGRDDFIVGASLADPDGRENAGSAIVYSGADGSVLYRKDGVAAGDRFGISVSIGDDLDGDGQADFGVGATEDDPVATTRAGSAYFFSGTDGALIYQLSGTVVGSQFGRSVCVGGDVNGDGKADFAIGAATEMVTGVVDAGRAQVFVTASELGIVPSQSTFSAGVRGAGISSIPTVAANGSKQFAPSGGTGPYTWSLITDHSGGSLSDSGLYTAGPAGDVHDTVRISDALGRTHDTRVQVSGAAAAAAPPRRPTRLIATPASSSAIQLSWTDASSTETGFQVEIRTPAGTWSLATSVAAGSTTTTLNGLQAKTLHFLRVKAFHATADSLWSPRASATTLP